ncbi:hypothetical protein BSKO_07678 [Bryopsis sp. KO-2023]|nr:hypothetical protein BSKO_07678 [Bryopsis sp. KO-2023]
MFSPSTQSISQRTLIAFQPRVHNAVPKRSMRVRASEKNKPDKPETGAGLKAVWYASEQFGNLLGMTKGSSDSTTAKTPSEKMTRQEVVESIRADYDQNYFVSGKGDMIAYEEDCLFADPFAGFNGVDRFKKNVGNLGGLMEDVKLDVYDFQEDGNEIKTKWRFSCLLDLPWQPRLAAGGSTTHVLDEDTNKVVKHIEDWDVEPSRVVKELLKPASRVPRNQWEVFFLAMSGGDYKGMWFAISRPTWIWSLPIVGVSLVTKITTGEGLQGVFLGTVEGFAYLFLLAGLGTEVVKLLQGMQGGETGTGGRF